MCVLAASSQTAFSAPRGRRSVHTCFSSMGSYRVGVLSDERAFDEPPPCQVSVEADIEDEGGSGLTSCALKYCCTSMVAACDAAAE